MQDRTESAHFGKTAKTLLQEAESEMADQDKQGEPLANIKHHSGRKTRSSSENFNSRISQENPIGTPGQYYIDVA